MRRAFVLAAVVAACTASPPPPPAPPRDVVVTQVPGEPAAFDADPRVRYPDGSRIVRLDLARPGAAQRVLSDGLAAAGGAAVRADGARIAFVAKENPDGRFGVWTCDPDGSGRVKSVEDAADCGSAAFLPDGRVVFSAGSGSSWALFVTSAKDAAPQRITFSGGADTDPSMLPDGRIVFASRAADAKEFALFAVHVDGTGIGSLDRDCVPATPTEAELAGAGAPGLRAVAGVALAARAKPQGHLSVVDPSKSFGDVFCVDARPEGSATARRARFTSTSGLGRVLGDVPLESDGSLFVRLPADVPIVLDLIDADGRVVAGQRTPFWVRPGETRGCVGCHEAPDTTPPNVRPRAVLDPPVPVGSFHPHESAR
jgi:hypothetical protein